MAVRCARNLILITLFLTGMMSTVWSESINPSTLVLVNANIYQPSARSSYGFYRINATTLEREFISISEAANLRNTRMSSDGNYALGERFDLATYTEDLYLVDLNSRTVHRLTYTPARRLSDNGMITGKFTKYGFSPDNRFAMILFPNGVEITPTGSIAPLMSQDISNHSSAIVFIDLNAFKVSGGVDSITIIDAPDFPVFSPSGQRFMMPMKRAESDSLKAMVYEIGQDSRGNTVFTGYDLPYNDVHQGAFITENQLYLVNASELIMYDLVGSRVRQVRDLSGDRLMGSGYLSPQMPGFQNFSNGALAFKGKHYAMLVTAQERATSDGFTRQPSIFDAYSVSDDQNLAIIRGDFTSSNVDYIEIPRLPETKYSNYVLYHYIYLPDEMDDVAILITNGWRNPVFRIIDFKKKSVSSPQAGFFLGVSVNRDGIIYIKTCDNNSTPYRNNSNFIFSNVRTNGRTSSVRVNRIYYMDIETGSERILINESCHVAEAFLVR